MLRYLSIKNYALIESLELDFERGMTVFTGETGAGKSILLGALCLVLGSRADSDYFRDKDQSIIVEAIFDLAGMPTIQGCIADALPDECDLTEIIVRREVQPQGRTKCFVNGMLIPVATLKTIGTYLVDIHGQHDHQVLFDRERHIVFLDSYCGIEALLDEYRAEYAEYRAVMALRDDCVSAESNKLRELDMLTYQIEEIENVSPQIDEDDALERDIAILKNSEKIRQVVDTAYEALYNGEASVFEKLGVASRALADLNKFDAGMPEVAEGVDRALVEVEESVRAMQQFTADMPTDAGGLDAAQERLDSLMMLKRKYGGTIEQVLAFLDESREKRDRLSMNEVMIAEYNEKLAAFERVLMKKAKVLRTKRKKGADDLRMRIEGELAAVAMSDARFSVAMQDVALNERGADSIDFMLSANKGEELKPLQKIASGGEASRIMLAFKRILASVDQVVTLIFDEIDANIGGRLGKTVGAKMKEIAQDRQVLLITHLPQIAGCGDVHVKVEKVHAADRTVTQCRVLNADERVDELAQMLSGKGASKVSQDHAREMMEVD